MNASLAPCATPPIPSPNSHWREWVAYGLSWASAMKPVRAPRPAPAVDRQSHHDGARIPGGCDPAPAGRRCTTPPGRLTATGTPVRGWTPGRRWRVRDALPVPARTGPDLGAAVRLSRHDSVAARMLSMWRLPAFAVGCSQVVTAGRTARSGAQLRLRPGALRSRHCVHRLLGAPPRCSARATCSGDCWTG